MNATCFSSLESPSFAADARVHSRRTRSVPHLVKSNGKGKQATPLRAKEALERSPFLESVTSQAGCRELRAVLIKLMEELGDQPEKLSQRLLALERIALSFVFKTVPQAERRNRVRVMLHSMHRDADIPQAFRLTAGEKRACMEGLNAPFVGPKLKSVATAILLKLNESHEKFQCGMASQSKTAKPAKRHARAGAMGASMHDEAEISQVYQLTAEERTSCLESVVSLEHVMPQKADETSWAEDWPDRDKRGEWLPMLGNLAILNRKMNSKMGNGDFATKKWEFEKSPYPLTREIADYVAWGEKDVA
ncbi:hypothetical protein T484DRAFT_1811291 [Baffinella frigidus]|nr:hypothetical protein T484DRAFT_1811291 [Cryptophyta sp. CCMP2293]